MDDAVLRVSVNQFKEITGSTSDDVARQMLNACDGNLEQAIGLFFASDGAVEVNTRVNQPPAQVNQHTGATDDPIVLDGFDGVRLPMAPVTERLVGGSYRQYYGGNERRQPANAVFEQFHDFSAGGPNRRRGNATSADAPDKSLQGLAALFRPPVDIMESRDWESLLHTAREKGRWILVNVQDSTEFSCQVLNRDCWSNEPLKNFIKENFLFWQTYITSPDGRRVVNYYSLKTYPAVFIVDPRTSERIHTIVTQNPNEMIGDLIDFCERYPSFSVYDDKFRATILPRSVKPSVNSEPPAKDEKVGQHTSNVVSAQTPLIEPMGTDVNLPISSSATPKDASNTDKPVEQPTAETVRERREKFLRQLEGK